MTIKSFFRHASMLSLLVVFFALITISCADDAQPKLSNEADILTFAFSALDPPITAQITGTNITANVPYNQNVTALVPAITVSPEASLVPATGVAQNFTNPVTYTVTAQDGTVKTYTVTVTKETPPVLVATPVWQKNLNSGGLPSWFTPNNDRDIAAHGDYVYIHSNNDKIRVVSAVDGSDVSAGAEGFIDGKKNFASGNLFLLGTATDNQGRIIASNLRVGSDALNPWNVYKWEDKDAEQELLFQYPTPAGVRLGENLSVVGDVAGDALIYVPGSGFGTSSNQVLKFTIANGVPNLTPTVITLAGITNLGNAPDVYPVSSDANANLIVAGTGMAGISEFTQQGALVGKLPEALNTGNTALLFTFALDVAAFEIQGRKVIATTATDFTENAATSGYLYLIDYTDGWANLTDANIIRTPFTAAGGIDTNFNGTGGVSVVVNGNTATVYAMITNFGIGAYTVSFN